MTIDDALQLLIVPCSLSPQRIEIASYLAGKCPLVTALKMAAFNSGKYIKKASTKYTLQLN
jgi:hypothetical protein